MKITLSSCIAIFSMASENSLLIELILNDRMIE
jgi:hypothetical protein